MSSLSLSAFESMKSFLTVKSDISTPVACLTLYWLHN